LEEHDLTNVLNQIPADAFNDLFTGRWWTQQFQSSPGFSIQLFYITYSLLPTSLLWYTEFSHLFFLPILSPFQFLVTSFLSSYLFHTWMNHCVLCHSIGLGPVNMKSVHLAVSLLCPCCYFPVLTKDSTERLYLLVSCCFYCSISENIYVPRWKLKDSDMGRCKCFERAYRFLHVPWKWKQWSL
jgi:hypothetical protein